ncbi:MAG: hypothetical protein WCO82_05305 [Sphingomonadales bacterium]
MPGQSDPVENDEGASADLASAVIGNLADLARDQLLAIADDGKAALAGNLDDAATMIRDLGGQLEGQVLAPLAPVLATGAGWLGALADDIADRDVADMVAEGRALVVARPELAAALAGVAGLVLGRVIRNLAAGRGR